MTTPTEIVLAKLPGAKRSGKDWSARCPAHEDRNASLSIGTGDDGRALVHCHAGCEPAAIVGALGLKLADLMHDAAPRTRPAPKSPPRSVPKASAPKAAAFAAPAEAVAALERQLGPLADRWVYRDAQGQYVGFVVRWNTSNGKEIRPLAKCGDGWNIGAMPEPRPVYDLPELLARPDERVYVVEGEKCADALANRLHLLATTSAGGAKAAAKTDWTALAGRDVVIVPDHDEAGAKYAGDVAEILEKLDPPSSVRVVNLADAWPDLGEGGDLADVVNAGEDFDAIKAKLAALVDAATPKAPAPAGPVMVCLADVEPREIEWLWTGRVPMGRLTLLAGVPGLGKSFVTCDMASRITTGSPWPDGSDCPSGSVILVSAEDDPADTIRPRLDAHRADVRKVHLLTAIRRMGDDGKLHEVMFTLADLPALEQVLQAHADCKLIVVDPVGSFLGGRTDAHRDNEVRAVLAPLAKLAEKYGPAVLLVAHLRKSSGASADELVLGSRAFTGIARAVWHLTRDKENKARRLLLPGKNNLAREGYGLAFTIGGEPAAIQWEKDPVELCADDVLADATRRGPEPHAQDQAAEWLAGELEDGREHPVKALKDAAKEAGLAWRTVQKASQRLKVRVHRGTFGGGCVWRLSKLAASDPAVRADPVENGEPGAKGANDDLHGKTDDSVERECQSRRDVSLDADDADKGEEWGEV